MKKLWEVILNSTVYRIISVFIQMLMVSLMFELATNWKVVVSCNMVCFFWYVVYHMAVIHIRRGSKSRSGKLPIVTAYMSHPIRGITGDAATKEVQIANSEKARSAAMVLRNKINGLDVYCPGDAEKFVYLTYANGWLTDDQILEIDCKIEEDCDLLLVYEFDRLGKGCRVEIEAADKFGIPIIRFSEVTPEVISSIRTLVHSISRDKWEKNLLSKLNVHHPKTVV